MSAPFIIRASEYFLPTLRETPAEASIVSHRYMLRAGMIRQAGAGIYSWLPMGLRVLEKISQIIREEQNRIGAQEMLMPIIQNADIWKDSGRYDSYGREMLRFQDRHGKDMLFGPTNEELITQIYAQTAENWRRAPLTMYQLQWKFRDEIRPRFGVMRGREFYMKDAYSFDPDEHTAQYSYNKMFASYLRIFSRMQLQALPVSADAGPIGGKLSHEFLILADTGESEIFYDARILDSREPVANPETPEKLQKWVRDWTQYYAAADARHNAETFEIETPAQFRRAARAIEIGHIFSFGTEYSKIFKAFPPGGQIPVRMGSYGIGISRLVGALIETHHDAHGIIWPLSIAPFSVGVLELSHEDDKTQQKMQECLKILASLGIETLYDDRRERPGVKFADMDLLGLPFQIRIGERDARQNLVEFKNRQTGALSRIPLDQAVENIQKARSAISKEIE